MIQYNYVSCQGCHKAVSPRYRCGSRNLPLKVIFHKVKIYFYQQMHLLLNIKSAKIYIKISYIRTYMFRFIWTILRELRLSLAKVTLL